VHISEDNNSMESSIPVELGNLSSLETLWLGTYVKEIQFFVPLIYCTWTELKNMISYMNTERNELSGRIPSELGSLKRLNYLFFGRFCGELISFIFSLNLHLLCCYIAILRQQRAEWNYSNST